jgi:hypothetical protein
MGVKPTGRMALPPSPTKREPRAEFGKRDATVQNSIRYLSGGISVILLAYALIVGGEAYATHDQAARYKQSPRCAPTPSPDCRAFIQVQVTVEPYRTRNRGVLWAALPDGTRESFLAPDSSYGRHQYTGSVQAEYWNGHITRIFSRDGGPA